MSIKDLSLAILVVFIWGINFSVIKIGLGAMDPFLLTSLRFFFTAIPLIFFLPKPDVKMSIVALYGLLFGVGLWGLVILGVFLGATPGVASLLLQFSAFFTVILGYVYFSEKLNNAQIIGVIIAFSGLVVLILSKDKVSLLYPFALVILGAVAWSFSNVIIKKSSPTNMLSFIVWSSLFSPAPLLLLTYATNDSFSFISAISEINYLGVFSIFFQVYITTAIPAHGVSC